MKYPLIILILALLFCSCSKGKEYTGTYELDIAQSDLGHYAADSDQYRGLLLTIKPDHTFEFSKDVPFIFEQKGKWSIKYYWTLIAVLNHKCVLSYGPAANGREDDLSPGTHAVCIMAPLSKDDTKQIEKLWFEKVRQ